MSIKFYGSYKEWSAISPRFWEGSFVECDCHTEHADYNNDNTCDFCNIEIDNSTETPVEPCDCNCHAGGIKAFFFKFINFFKKIFSKAARTCACGAAH